MASGYDADAGRLYVFGGWNYPPFRYFNDVHELDVAGLVWRRLEPGGVPPLARRNAAGVFAPAGSGLVVFGGDIWPNVYFNDTHLLRLNAGPGGEWVSLPIGPR
jgi:hypothetical protein